MLWVVRSLSRSLSCALVAGKEGWDAPVALCYANPAQRRLRCVVADRCLQFEQPFARGWAREVAVGISRSGACSPSDSRRRKSSLHRSKHTAVSESV